MDALALLCNLHAEGPAALRRLRRSGLDTLDAVTKIPIDDLAEVLVAPPSFARRFVRESRLLAERLLDPEPEEESAVSVEARAAALGSRVIAVPSAAPIVAPPAPESRSPAPPASAPAALEPRGDLPSPAAKTPPAGSRLRTRATVLSRPDETPQALRAGLLEGLDQALCERLVAQGIRTLPGLVESAGLALARRVGLSLPRLLELQSIAAERLHEAPPAIDPAVEATRKAETAPEEDRGETSEIRLRTVELVPRPAGGGPPPEHRASPAAARTSSVPAEAPGARPAPSPAHLPAGGGESSDHDAAGPFA